MTKHKLYRVPTHFRTDAGKVFPIKVVKTNIRSVLIKFHDGKGDQLIKVKQKSHKLLYGKE